MLHIAYIISNINKALAFEWIATNINKDIHSVTFILLNPGNSTLETFLKHTQIQTYRVTYTSKKDLPKTILLIYKFSKINKIDVVHCHMFDACIAGLIAAKLAGVKKRIFTRHHATFHQVYFPRAVWYDKFISSMATDIVAISENVKKTLVHEGVISDRVHLIHHGFELSEFTNMDKSRIDALKMKYNKSKAFPVVGVISRYFELKGIQFIIPAFKQLLSDFPEALLILANASGNYKEQISLLLKEVPEKNFLEIPFEEDIFSLYQLFDIFIHVPINPQIEAFGQTYVEALAAGVPSIFTLSGVAPEFIVHHQNAWVVPFKDSSAIYESMREILAEEKLKDNIIKQGEEDVKAKFNLQRMISSLEDLYEQ